METSNTFLLNTCILRALARNIAGRKDIRFYLNGVHVAPHPEGVIYTATDGHMCVRFIDRDAPDVPFDNEGAILDGELLRSLPALTATQRRNRSNEYTECEPVKKNMFKMNGVLFTPFDAKFPDCDRIFSLSAHNRSGELAHVRAEYLMKTEKCVHERRGSNVYGLAWSHNGKDEAIFTGDDEFCAVIMPMRAGEMPTPQSWMKTSGRQIAKSFPALECIDVHASIEKSRHTHDGDNVMRMRHCVALAIAAARGDSKRNKQRAILRLLRIGAVFKSNIPYNRCNAGFRDTHLIASAPHELPAWATSKPKRVKPAIHTVTLDEVQIEYAFGGVIAKNSKDVVLRYDPDTSKPYCFRSAAAAIAWVYDEIRKRDRVRA
jgi:hypothetical protein